MHSGGNMMLAAPRRLILPLVLLAVLAAGPLAAQVAPTLPRDTLGGRTLPPTAEVVPSSAPTTPSDTLNARSRDSVAAAKQPADTSPAANPAKRPRNPRLRVPH